MSKTSNECVKLADINLDTSIQCRASINVETVSDYAADMEAGKADDFPAVILFGEYIGDGWHRIMAAQQAGLDEIKADCRKGGRIDALKFALGANAANGLRRSNMDKRRAVEIALAEFPKSSSRAIAELCGVGVHMVSDKRQVCETHTSPTVTGMDNKTYPARKVKRAEAFKTPEGEEAWYEKEESKPEASAETKVEEPKPLMEISVTAQVIADKSMFFLSQIKPRMAGRKEALESVIQWCEKEIRRTK